MIGSGISALTYALEAGRLGRRVIVVTKRGLPDANTRWAQGGLASVMSPDDSFDAHVGDTLRAGAGLCRPEVVEAVVREGPAAVARLVELGVSFDQRRSGDASPDEVVGYDLTREGGHSFRRVLHAGDVTGIELSNRLERAVRAHPRIEILEQHCAIDLLTVRKVQGMRNGSGFHRASAQNRCLGAYVLDERQSRVETFRAKVTVLATGGASKVYLYTSNPDVATGDGIAMAYRVGADIANMEFIQFHPTCLFHPHAKSFLISEALRGEGGRLQRRDGARFMEHYHPMKELAPRDIVARAIDSEMKRTGDEFVELDMTHLEPVFLMERFPTIHATCMQYGIDMRVQPIPVVPAAHYVCGGVRTDLCGKTTIEGLYAVGEVSCTGLHGANRLASNSLLEGAVFGHRAAVAADPLAKADFHHDDPDTPPWDRGSAVESDELVVISQCWDEIRRFMWNYVGIVRTDRRLKRAQRRIVTLKEEIAEFYWNAVVTRDLVELRNICVVAELIVKSALNRRESRGLHYNADCPDLARNDPPRDTILKRESLV